MTLCTTPIYTFTDDVPDMVHSLFNLLNKLTLITSEPDLSFVGYSKPRDYNYRLCWKVVYAARHQLEGA